MELEDEHDCSVHSLTWCNDEALVRNEGGTRRASAKDLLFSLALPWDGMEALICWLKDLEGATMDAGTIFRMGFDEDEDGASDDADYTIERVVLASGKKHGWSASTYYASAVKHHAYKSVELICIILRSSLEHSFTTSLSVPS